MATVTSAAASTSLAETSDDRFAIEIAAVSYVPPSDFASVDGTLDRDKLRFYLDSLSDVNDPQDPRLAGFYRTLGVQRANWLDLTARYPDAARAILKVAIALADVMIAHQGLDDNAYSLKAAHFLAPLIVTESAGIVYAMTPAPVLRSYGARDCGYSVSGASPAQTLYANLSRDLTVFIDGRPDNLCYAPEKNGYALTASAGSDVAVDEGAIFTLDGSRSRVSVEDDLSYFWTQSGGPAVSWVSDATGTSLTLKAPTVFDDATVLAFRLTVTDSMTGRSVTDEVLVTVNNTINEIPTVAISGNTRAHAGQTVRLTARAQDANPSDTLRLRWDEPSGKVKRFSVAPGKNPGESVLTFTVPESAAGQKIIWHVSVDDGHGTDGVAQDEHRMTIASSQPATATKVTPDAVKTALIDAVVLPPDLQGKKQVYELDILCDASGSMDVVAGTLRDKMAALIDEALNQVAPDGMLRLRLSYFDDGRTYVLVPQDRSDGFIEVRRDDAAAIAALKAQATAGAARLVATIAARKSGIETAWVSAEHELSDVLSITGDPRDSCCYSRLVVIGDEELYHAENLYGVDPRAVAITAEANDVSLKVIEFDNSRRYLALLTAQNALSPEVSDWVDSLMGLRDPDTYEGLCDFFFDASKDEAFRLAVYREFQSSVVISGSMMDALNNGIYARYENHLLPDATRAMAVILYACALENSPASRELFLNLIVDAPDESPLVKHAAQDALEVQEWDF